jgi:hypothetical protein
LSKDFDVQIEALKSTFTYDDEQQRQKLETISCQLINEHNEEIQRLNIEHNKLLDELNCRLRSAGNIDEHLFTSVNRLCCFIVENEMTRFVSIENDFQQLKNEHEILHAKDNELVQTCSTLNDNNRQLLTTIERITNEKTQLQVQYDEIEQRMIRDSQQWQIVREQQQNELHARSTITDERRTEFEQTIESLQIRINNYENAVSQYEEYRLKLEGNLERITQQRDMAKGDLRLTRDLLVNKENECQQMKLRFEQHERTFETTKGQWETMLKQRADEYERDLEQLKQTTTNEIRVSPTNTLTVVVSYEIRSFLYV